MGRHDLHAGHRCGHQREADPSWRSVRRAPDAGVYIQDPTQPHRVRQRHPCRRGPAAWPYKQEYQAWNDTWKQTTTPRTWLRDSVVWYSQVLTRKLGAARLQGYVDKLAYANRDLSGEPGRNDGLTTAWLSSSLRISATEQVEFVRRMIRTQLPVSRTAIDRTMALMPVAVTGGWRVSGKTGTGFERRADGRNDPERQVGWFVGWATHEGRTVVFVRLLEDQQPERVNAGLRARDALLGDWPALVTPP